MRTITRLGAAILGLVALATGWSIAAGEASGVAVRPGVVVFSDDPAQRELARWAVGRFERAGLDAPSVEIRFHGDPSGCEGNLGWAQSGQVEVCTVLANEMSRRTLLHEMSHVWLDQHVSESVRERFLELRRLRSWNASSVPWPERGFEQAAEIMAWALGDRILTPQIPDIEPAKIETAYRLLTGSAPPEPP